MSHAVKGHPRRMGPDVQVGFRKGRETRDQIANICWIIKKARAFLKNIYFYFTDYTKAFDCVGHNKLWEILRDRRTRSTCQHPLDHKESKRIAEKISTSASPTRAKAFDCVDHNKLWKILKGIGVPDHLSCLLRNLSVGHEATVRTGDGTPDWLKIGKAFIVTLFT